MDHPRVHVSSDGKITLCNLRLSEHPRHSWTHFERLVANRCGDCLERFTPEQKAQLLKEQGE